MIRAAALRLIDLLRRLGERFAVPIGLAALVIAGVIVWIIATSVNSVPFSNPYRVNAIVPADAPILRAGDEVRVAGRRMGQVREVEPSEKGRIVSFDVEDGPVGHDATVTVRQRGFSGSVYIFLRRGDVSRPLPEGGTIPLSRTRTNEELASVVTAFDRESRRALERTLEGYGGGFLDRGEDVNDLVADLPPFARDAVPVMRSFAPGRGELSGFLHELDRTSRGFAPPGNRDLGGLVSSARGTLEVTAQEDESLGEFIDELRPFEDVALETLPVADRLLDDTLAMARRFTPSTAELTATLPDLNALLAAGPGLRELTRFSRAARPVLDRGTPLMDELFPVGPSLTRLAGPLEPVASHLELYRGDLLRAMSQWLDWNRFRYAAGKASGHRAVRFSPVFTCHRGRDPYPEPGETGTQETSGFQESCR